ncbi:unnamed protein product, partial [Closterium sp. Naga37s-1]
NASMRLFRSGAVPPGNGRVRGSVQMSVASLLSLVASNASMRLFGGAQYHRAMAEFRFVAVLVSLALKNVCDAEDVHDGTNYFSSARVSGHERVRSVEGVHDGTDYFRTACVIAVAKAWDVFEPFLRQLGFRLSHIVGRLLPIVLFLLKRDNEPMLVHETFIERSECRESYHKFVDATERSCIDRCMEDLTSTTRFNMCSLHNTMFNTQVSVQSQTTPVFSGLCLSTRLLLRALRCMEDLTSTTRFVTWSLHNRSRSALRSFFDSAMPNQDSSLLAAVGAFEASTPMPAYYGIHGSLGARLFEIATHVCPICLSILAVFDKGSPDEIDRMCFQVMDVLKSGKIDRREVEEVIRSALTTVFGPQHTLPPALIQAFVSSAFPSSPTSSTRASLSHSSRDSSSPTSTALHPSSGQSSTAAASLHASAASAAPLDRAGGGQEQPEGKEVGRPEQEGESVGRDGSAGASFAADPSVDDDTRADDDGGSVAADDGRELSYQDAVRWWTAVPAVKKFLRSLLTPPDLRPPLPTLVAPAVTASGRQIISEAGVQRRDSREETWLLQKELTWHIAGALQDKECREWCLLYSSKLHGLSFNSFLGKVSSVPHPTVLVVRDSAGAIFGAFASKPWERGSAFFGDMRSFLFSFLPAAAVFKAAGTSTNIQWVRGSVRRYSRCLADIPTSPSPSYQPQCASGFASESIPNGIGLGGQPGHFGLFLSADFDSGHSRPSTTFNSPSLSSSPNFSIDAVECWAVISASLSDRISAGDGGIGAIGSSGSRVGSGRSDHAGSGRGTVLDRFGKERAMLGMMGIATASENIGRDTTDCER